MKQTYCIDLNDRLRVWKINIRINSKYYFSPPTHTHTSSQRAVAYDDMGYSYMSIIYKITYDHILTHICVFLAHIRVPIYRTGI